MAYLETLARRIQQGHQQLGVRTYGSEYSEGDKLYMSATYS